MEKWPEVRIFGEPMRVRAEMASLDELSGHADQRELLEWMKPIAGQPAKGVPGARGAEQSGHIGSTAEKQYNLEAVCPGRGRRSSFLG